MKTKWRDVGRIGGEHSYNPNVDDEVNWLGRIRKVGNKKTLEFPTHVTGHMSREEIEEKQAQLAEQTELFELEKQLTEDLHKLRDDVMAWHDEQITLPEILEAMMQNGLCQRIGVWSQQG